MSRAPRKVKLWTSPEVIASHYEGPEITVRVRGTMGPATAVEAVGVLSPHCAARLVRELRAALRTIRKEQLARMDAEIAAAEGPV